MIAVSGEHLLISAIMFPASHNTQKHNSSRALPLRLRSSSSMAVVGGAAGAGWESYLGAAASSCATCWSQSTDTGGENS